MFETINSRYHGAFVVLSLHTGHQPLEEITFRDCHCERTTGADDVEVAGGASSLSWFTTSVSYRRFAFGASSKGKSSLDGPVCRSLGAEPSNLWNSGLCHYVNIPCLRPYLLQYNALLMIGMNLCVLTAASAKATLFQRLSYLAFSSLQFCHMKNHQTRVLPSHHQMKELVMFSHHHTIVKSPLTVKNGYPHEQQMKADRHHSSVFILFCSYQAELLKWLMCGAMLPFHLRGAISLRWTNKIESLDRANSPGRFEQDSRNRDAVSALAIRLAKPSAIRHCLFGKAISWYRPECSLL